GRHHTQRRHQGHRAPGPLFRGRAHRRDTGQRPAGRAGRSVLVGWKMTALDRKLLRDLLRLWPQALAIALVVASGVATLILGIGTHRSLDETRRAYYEQYQFADVF